MDAHDEEDESEDDESGALGEFFGIMFKSSGKHATGGGGYRVLDTSDETGGESGDSLPDTRANPRRYLANDSLRS